MEIKNFFENVRVTVENKMIEKGFSCNVSVNEMIKNNGLISHGIIITKSDSNISPTIYLDQYYEKYESGELTLTEIAEEVIDTSEKNELTQKLDISFLTKYETIKNHIVFQLVNKEKNKDLLKSLPHIDYLDLAIIFKVIISLEGGMMSSAKVSNSFFKTWGVSIDTVYEDAKKNTTEIMKAKIISMKDMLGLEIAGDIPMEIIGNESGMNGAATILYPDILKNIAEKYNENLYLLPSSIHEFIAVPAYNDINAEELKYMVNEVNHEVIRTDEILSDSVYYFNKENGEITKIA